MTQTKEAPAMLTSVTDVRKALDEIRAAAAAGDDERAHVLEDAMRTAVLEAVASGNAQAGYIAAEALKSAEIEFGRWTA